MLKKKRILTEKEQKVAVDILNRLCFVKSLDELFKETDVLAKKYYLWSDPFTRMYCTQREYSKNLLEYERQTMLDLYGHCDGLD